MYTDDILPYGQSFHKEYEWRQATPAKQLREITDRVENAYEDWKSGEFTLDEYLSMVGWFADQVNVLHSYLNFAKWGEPVTYEGAKEKE